MPMGSPEERLKRMQTLFSLIIKASPANEKRLIAEYCLRTGVNKIKVKEYISLMIDAEKIKREGELLYAENNVSAGS